MEVLLISTCGLVVNHLHNVKKTGKMKPKNSKNIPNPIEVTPQAPQEQTLGTSVLNNDPVVSVPVGVRTLKTQNTNTPGYDEKRFESQFFPQEVSPQITEKPWLRIINSPYRPKEEILSADPTPQDIMGKNMLKKKSAMEQGFAKSTVPVTSEKQFDRPVEQIATGNGSNRGFHIGGAQRYHNFIFNDQATIESEGGPKGAFSGAGGSHVKGEYKTTTQRASMNHESVGPPVAIGVPQSSAPLPSFDITAAHMESWKLDDHTMANSRGPVTKVAPISNSSVHVAHDENLQVLDTSLARGGDRFATGASGNRNAQIHVPKNNDPIDGFGERVVPNFKIGKASDKKDQEIRIKNTFIPEMSQNVSALMKNRKAPVSGNSSFKNSEVDISAVSVGTSSRGLSLQSMSTPRDAFRTTDKSEVMGEAVANARGGVAITRLVSGPKNVDSKFRTTNSLSETVSTPLIRGSGGHNAHAVQPMHTETDSSLSEVGSFYARSGVNKYKKPVVTSTIKNFNDDRSKIETGTNRVNFLPSTNKDLPVGLAHNPTGSVTASNVSMNFKKENTVDMSSGFQKNNFNKFDKSKMVNGTRVGSQSGATKNRRMGDVLNSRLGTSSALKKLLNNPYSSPAASRLTSN